jgi:hypothetical protein
MKNQKIITFLSYAGAFLITGAVISRFYYGHTLPGTIAAALGLICILSTVKYHKK